MFTDPWTLLFHNTNFQLDNFVTTKASGMTGPIKAIILNESTITQHWVNGGHHPVTEHKRSIVIHCHKAP